MTRLKVNNLYFLRFTINSLVVKHKTLKLHLVTPPGPRGGLASSYPHTDSSHSIRWHPSIYLMVGIAETHLRMELMGRPVSHVRIPDFLTSGELGQRLRSSIWLSRCNPVNLSVEKFFSQLLHLNPLLTQCFSVCLMCWFPVVSVYSHRVQLSPKHLRLPRCGCVVCVL